MSRGSSSLYVTGRTAARACPLPSPAADLRLCACACACACVWVCAQPGVLPRANAPRGIARGRLVSVVIREVARDGHNNWRARCAVATSEQLKQQQVRERQQLKEQREQQEREANAMRKATAGERRALLAAPAVNPWTGKQIDTATAATASGGAGAGGDTGAAAASPSGAECDGRKVDASEGGISNGSKAPEANATTAHSTSGDSGDSGVGDDASAPVDKTEASPHTTDNACEEEARPKPKSFADAARRAVGLPPASDATLQQSEDSDGKASAGGAGKVDGSGGAKKPLSAGAPAFVPKFGGASTALAAATAAPPQAPYAVPYTLVPTSDGMAPAYMAPPAWMPMDMACDGDCCPDCCPLTLMVRGIRGCIRANSLSLLSLRLTHCVLSFLCVLCACVRVCVGCAGAVHRVCTPVAR